MRRWITNLSSLALMLIIPVVGWIGYLNYGVRRHWFDPVALTTGPWHEPARSRIIAGLLLTLALAGLHRATPQWPWHVKGLCAIALAGFLLCTFLFFGFAAALTGSTRMP